MDGIKIQVTGNIAKVTEKPKRIIAGTIGLPVEFYFDETWDDIVKTAVFVAGENVSRLDEIDGKTTVPWEVLQNPGPWLSIGVYGESSDGEKSIPTTWANVSPILFGTSLSGDPTDPSAAPIWQKLKDEMESVKDLVEEGYISNASINKKGELELTFLDGSVVNVGKVVGGSDIVVVDNLGSGDSNAALSARMGGVLKTKIEDDVSALNEQLQPQINQRVKTVNGVAPDENGNVVVEVPEGSGNVDLSGYATEQWVRDGYQPKGNYLTEVPAGYAKTEDVPTKPADIGAQPAGSYLTEVPSGYATEEYVRNKIAEAELGGEEVDLSGYAQKSELPTKVSQLQNDSGFITDYTETDPTVPSWAKQASKPSYTAAEVRARPSTWTPSASDVGADPKGTAANEVSEHNTADSSHGDIRLLITGLTNRLNALANSTDTDLDQMAELVAYIKNNKSLIDGITTGKVSVADIVNNLTTNVANKPLSAAQGVALKALIDAITVPTKLSQLTNDKGYLTQHQDISGKVNKSGLTLGFHEDGLLYVFVDGQPVGNGVELPTGGINGYVTPDNKIIIQGLPDGSYTAAYEYENGSTVNIGALVVDTNVYYTVTNTLTQCTTNNSATKAVQGGSYSATITAKSGYELKSIVVKMGGTDISSTAVSGGKITIANVTGNIVITAMAEEVKTETNFVEYNATNTNDWSIWINNARAGSDGAYRSDTYNEGYGTPAVSNYIAVQNGDIVEFTGIYTKGKNTVVYGSTKNVLKTATLTSQTTHLSGIALSSDEWDGQFTVNNSNVAFIRLGGYVKPESRDIVIKIKRNGEYL